MSPSALTLSLSLSGAKPGPKLSAHASAQSQTPSPTTPAPRKHSRSQLRPIRLPVSCSNCLTWEPRAHSPARGGGDRAPVSPRAPRSCPTALSCRITAPRTQHTLNRGQRSYFWPGNVRFTLPNGARIFVTLVTAAQKDPAPARLEGGNQCDELRRSPLGSPDRP